MKLEEFLKEKKVPDWLKGSKIYKNIDDYDFSEFEDIPICDLNIKNLNDFKNVIKAIKFWKIKSPYPYELWQFLITPYDSQVYYTEAYYYLQEKEEQKLNKY